MTCDESAVSANAAGTWRFSRQDAGEGWNADPAPLKIGFDGSIEYDGVPLAGAVIDCDGIRWPADGNPFSVTASLVGTTDDGDYWPAGPLAGPVLQGSITDPGGATQRFRASRETEQSNLCRFMNFGTGSFLTMAPGNSVGSAPLTLLDQSQVWQPQYGTIQSYSMDWVISVPDPPTAGTVPLMWAWASSPGQCWTIDGASLGSKPVPDLRLAASPPPDSNVRLAEASADASQAWLMAGDFFNIMDGDGRYLSNANGTLVATGDPPDQVGQMWLPVGGFIVSGLDGSYLGVAGAGEPEPGSAVLVGGFEGAGDGQWIVHETSIASVASPKLLLTADADGKVTLQPGGAPGQDWKWFPLGRLPWPPPAS